MRCARGGAHKSCPAWMNWSILKSIRNYGKREVTREGERERKRTQAKIANGRLKNPSRECLTYPCGYLHLIHAIVQGVYLEIYTPSSTACLQVYAKPRIAASHKSPLGTGLPNCCRRTKHAGATITQVRSRFQEALARKVRLAKGLHWKWDCESGHGVHRGAPNDKW